MGSWRSAEWPLDMVRWLISAAFLIPLSLSGLRWVALFFLLPPKLSDSSDSPVLIGSITVLTGLGDVGDRSDRSWVSGPVDLKHKP